MPRRRSAFDTTLLGRAPARTSRLRNPVVIAPIIGPTKPHHRSDAVAAHHRTLRTRLMVQLAGIIASQAVSEYQTMLGAAPTAGVTPVEAKEIVYHALPYVGMAKVFGVLHATNDVLTARGIELPLPGPLNGLRMVDEVTPP
ncbi:carboxymuconolactone decarboxylase family protein [uncultured Friedmanniella sp.]|uniref:carboxymuconolactone decarboxylase family protein n=1 Tax=uncultured Friedmanniella sp. TaxID=335381 RepID=UPI0035CC1357